jgi:hypothetical protein
MRAKPRAVLTALLLSGMASKALALDEADRMAARAAITRQVEAFGRDDAGAAYAQAAPGIQALFPTPEVFLGMVRTQYRAVYRHRSFAFADTRETGGDALRQDARIQDQDGIDWEAEYGVERQPDGTWRITGCRLTRAAGTNT